MKVYVCSYSYAMPCSIQFKVAARSKKDARKKLKDMLAKGKFDDVKGTTGWSAPKQNNRVTVIGALRIGFGDTIKTVDKVTAKYCATCGNERLLCTCTPIERY
jgi:hypothetical protein